MKQFVLIFSGWDGLYLQNKEQWILETKFVALFYKFLQVGENRLQKGGKWTEEKQASSFLARYTDRICTKFSGKLEQGAIMLCAKNGWKILNMRSYSSETLFSRSLEMHVLFENISKSSKIEF